jgi:hypothetical protein
VKLKIVKLDELAALALLRRKVADKLSIGGM